MKDSKEENSTVADASVHPVVMRPRKSVKEIAADKLAYECARQIELRRIGERSGIGDALLNYMEIGFPGGPDDVPSWMAEYRRMNNISSGE